MSADVAIQHDQVGTLTGLQRAHLVLHAELIRRPQSVGVHRLGDRQRLVGRGQNRCVRLPDQLPGDADLDRVQRFVGREIACRRPIGAQRDPPARRQYVPGAIEEVLPWPAVARGHVRDGVGIRRHPVRGELCDDTELTEAGRVGGLDVDQMGDGVPAVACGIRLDRGLDRVQRGAGSALAAGVDVHVETGGVHRADQLSPLVAGER